MDFEMPRPGPQHEILARFVGSWVSEERLLPSPWSPEEQQRTGAITSRMLNGFFLIGDYEQRDGDEVTFRGHGVYSWDPAAEEFVMHWFDSMGGAGGLARGTFADDVLTYRNTSPMGHHRYRYTFQPDGSYRFEMAMSEDGETWNTLMDAVYRRA